MLMNRPDNVCVRTFYESLDYFDQPRTGPNGSTAGRRRRSPGVDSISRGYKLINASSMKARVSA